MSKSIFAFIAGAAVGAAAAYKYAEKKFKKIADEEIASVKEEFCCTAHSDIEEKKTEEPAEEEDSEEQSYTDAVSKYRSSPDGPRIISEEQYGEIEGYFNVTFVYYADGVVTDENDEIVEDVEESIGTEFKNYFEDDVVYVRNDRRRCDYTVERDARTYKETH